MIIEPWAEIKPTTWLKLQRQLVLIESKVWYTDRFSETEFIPGKSRVNYAGRVFDEKEIINAVNASLDFWLMEGRYSEEFSKKIAEFLGVEHVLLTNSGSSANLLAFSALSSEKLGEKRLKPGDEVISVAAGFPATVTPIIQYGLVPVFVDVDIPTYNIDVEMMRTAIKVKRQVLLHTSPRSRSTLLTTLQPAKAAPSVPTIPNWHNLYVLSVTGAATVIAPEAKTIPVANDSHNNLETFRLVSTINMSIPKLAIT